MLPMFRHSGRWPLGSPAAREGVPPGTLLRENIRLAKEIAESRTETFVIHRRNCKEVIRLVGLVLAFLEEIQDDGRPVPVSAVAGLSELHVALRRIGVLIRECWVGIRILMAGDRVCEEFVGAIRLVSTAVDVVLMEDVGVSVEAEELGRLASKQAWKMKVEIEPDDEKAMSDVVGILEHFERNINAVDETAIRSVLAHLRIHSWSDCNVEIELLEEEIINSLGLEGDHHELVMLHGLLALMVYSRSVLFDVMDVERRHNEEHGGVPELFRNSDELKCPISLELMNDPVIVSTGLTYDRESIIRWLKAGNRTCPVTGKELVDHTHLIPNMALRSLIGKSFHHKNSRKSVQRANSPGSPAAAEVMKLVGQHLLSELSSGSNEERIKAVYEIQLLAKSSIFNRFCLVEAGVVPWLLHFLDSWDPSIQHGSMVAILTLSKHPDGRKVMFESGGLVSVVDVLNHGLTSDSKQRAAAVLFYLSSVEEYRQTIGETPEAIPAIVRMLKTGTFRGKMTALATLYGLLLFQGNYRKVLSAKAVRNLVELLSSDKDDLIRDALTILAALSERPEGCHAILQTSAVATMVELLRVSSSHTAKEYCVEIFLKIHSNNGSFIERLEKFHSLMPSLYSVMTDGSPRASKKASSLIGIIHESCGRRSANPNSPPEPQHGHTVHVR